MKDFFAKILEKPYWVLLLVVGAVFMVLSVEDVHISPFSLIPHAPILLLAIPGALLLIVSCAIFVLKMDLLSGLRFNAARVNSSEDADSVVIDRTVIEVRSGRIEDYREQSDGIMVVLPANEYFDDDCIRDEKSALGAYMRAAFGGGIAEAERVIGEARSQMNGDEVQKTETERAVSYGVGKVIRFRHNVIKGHLAIASVTRRRPPDGLEARVSYVFNAVDAIGRIAVNERIGQIVLPLFGSGHGALPPGLALASLVLAVADLAKTQGGRHISKVTIVVFRAAKATHPPPSRVMVRRILALAALSADESATSAQLDQGLVGATQ